LESLERNRPGARVTPFRRRVYAALLQVPEGKVTTYALVAEAIGCRSPRAVGQALKANPFAPAVPCHRVVGSDLGIGGYRGCVGGAVLMEKVRRLQAEGVAIADGKVADASFVFEPAKLARF